MIEAKTTKKPAGDTIGAGDAFAAGFLYGFLRNKELSKCGHLGDMLARLSTTEIGARAGLPSLPELSHHYQRRRGLPL
jgi:ribokinase